jgi:hypothetical protein
MPPGVASGHPAAAAVFRRFFGKFPGIPLSRAMNYHELVEKTLQLLPNELTYRVEVF